MNNNEIEKLLEAFYEGNTTLEEEQRLILYFQTNEVADHLKADQEFLLSLPQEDIHIPKHLSNNLNTLIDQWEEEEKKKREVRIGSFNKAFIWISGIAASFLILFSVWTYIGENQPELLTDTYNNPEKAYEETEKALRLVSHNLNKGIEQLETMRKEMEKVDNLLNKQLK